MPNVGGWIEKRVGTLSCIRLDRGRDDRTPKQESNESLRLTYYFPSTVVIDGSRLFRAEQEAK